MRRLSCLGLVLVVSLAGCASPHAGQTGARPTSGDPPVAVLERQLVKPDLTASFGEQTLLRVRGEDEDFLVLTGPLDAGWQSSGHAARGAFKRASGQGTWLIEQGYVFAWGLWPAVNTPRVAAGADGSALLVVVDMSNFGTVVREYVVFLEGTEATIKSHAGTLLQTMTAIDTWVEVTGSPSSPTVSEPAALTSATQALQDTVAEAKKRRDLLEGW